MKFQYVILLIVAVFTGLFSHRLAAEFIPSLVWQARYGIEMPSDDVDQDGDGVSDFEESIHGTDPTDSSSYFELILERRKTGVNFVQWPVQSGQKYKVQKRGIFDEWNDVGLVQSGHDGGLGRIELGEGALLVSNYRVIPTMSRVSNLTISQALSGRDTDGDGDSDLVEYNGGSSPIDGESSFEMVSGSEGDVVSLSWSSIKGGMYSIHRYDGEQWVKTEGGFAGDGSRCRHVLLDSQKNSIYRVVREHHDTDEDGLEDWEEILLGSDPTHAYGFSAIENDEAFVTPKLAIAGDLSLEVVRSVGDFDDELHGQLRVRRVNGFAACVVHLNVTGSADVGVDYRSLASTVEFGFGVTEVLIDVEPLRAMASVSKSVSVELLADPSYTIVGRANRSVVLRKLELLNVKDYGAVGDGMTDDTQSIQNALHQLEISSTANGLYFPNGTYRLASYYGETSVPIGSRRILKLGGGVGLENKDILLRGENGATLYSDVGSIRANMMVCVGKFRSLSVENLVIAQSSALLSPAYSVEPNGSDGFSIINDGLREVEEIVFRGCLFFNCHRSVSIYGIGYDLLGRCGNVTFRSCMFSNPYGSNTANGAAAWGGGQQLYLSPWVNEAVYEDNLFDGGGEVMTDTSLTGGGRMKDGCHFGSPRRLIFRRNIVKRMGVEAIFQTNDGTLMARSRTGFVVPAADGVTEATLEVNNMMSTWVVGDQIMIRQALSPGMPESNNHFRVSGFNSATNLLRIVNDGMEGNVPEGTSISANKVIYRDHEAEPSVALIEDNEFYGDLPPGGKAFAERSGIVFNGKSIIRNNFIQGFTSAILNYEEVHTPLFPAGAGSVIRDNMIVTRNSQNEPNVVTKGIYLADTRILVERNWIVCPVSYKCVGILHRGSHSVVRGNMVIADQIIRNGYSVSTRAVGIGQNNTGLKMLAIDNSTRGFDVGIGPGQASQWRTYYLRGHQSEDDVLAIDPIGLTAEP